MSTLLQQLSLLAREAEERGESARVHGADRDAALWFLAEELADKLSDVLDALLYVDVEELA